jgi:hypothetical protein
MFCTDKIKEIFVMMYNKIRKWISDPSSFFVSLISHLYFIPDKIYLRIQYMLICKEKLNIKFPETFNEKIQWLKLYDRISEYSKMVDKYEVRRYISEKIGEEYLIPLLGVWDKADDIEFEKLPNQFVLKCTHDSGGVIICKDRSKFNIQKSKIKLNRWLKRNYYYGGREYPYKDIKGRIIAEKYMIDESGVELKDYKIQCFNGEPKIIQVDFNRFSEQHKRNFYSIDWVYQHFSLLYPTYPEITIPKPQSLDLMLSLARELSHDIPYVRVDFYSIRERIYLGELTFHHGSGYEKFDPPECNRVLGIGLVLPPPPPLM